MVSHVDTEVLFLLSDQTKMKGPSRILQRQWPFPPWPLIPMLNSQQITLKTFLSTTQQSIPPFHFILFEREVYWDKIKSLELQIFEPVARPIFSNNSFGHSEHTWPVMTATRSIWKNWTNSPRIQLGHGKWQCLQFNKGSFTHNMLSQPSRFQLHRKSMAWRSLRIHLTHFQSIRLVSYKPSGLTQTITSRS